MQDLSRNRNPYYPDIPLFLILIPLISAFNYYLTYHNIRFNTFLLFTFCIDVVQGYIAWWLVRMLIIFMDKKYPFEKNPLRRILVQQFATLVIGLGAISLLTEITSWIARGRSAPLDFYTIDLFIIGIWFFVINGIYVGLHYYNEWRRSELRREEENRIKTEGLMVKSGKQDLKLAFEEIVGFYVDEGYVTVCHVNGKKFYLDQSLDKIESTVPSSYFFRINRQFLIHRQFVTGFKRGENGKLLVSLKPHENFPAETPISRTKAPAFKGWFKPD